MRATWRGAVLAESDDLVVIEGNHYFPAASLDQRHVEPSDETSFCGWKGQASYYDVVVGDERLPGGVWYYPDPLPEAEAVRGRVAFWRGVHIEP